MPITEDQLNILRSKRGAVRGRKLIPYSDAEVTEMRHDFWIGKVTIKEIAEKWRTSKTSVTAIVNGRTYKHVEFPKEWFEGPRELTTVPEDAPMHDEDEFFPDREL